MFVHIGDGVTRTRNHWADRSAWAGGRRQLTFHLTFEGSGLAEATASLRAAVAGLEAMDVVPAKWLHLTSTPLGFTDEVDPDAAVAVVDAVFAGGSPAGWELWFDTVLVGPEGVMLPARREPWLDDLVGRQRDAVDRHLGVREWRDFWPHTSLGYANAPAPAEGVVAALAGPAREASGFAVRPTLSLLELHCADHLYSWRVLRQE